MVSIVADCNAAGDKRQMRLKKPALKIERRSPKCILDSDLQLHEPDLQGFENLEGLRPDQRHSQTEFGNEAKSQFSQKSTHSTNFGG